MTGTQSTTVEDKLLFELEERLFGYFLLYEFESFGHELWLEDVEEGLQIDFVCFEGHSFYFSFVIKSDLYIFFGWFDIFCDVVDYWIILMLIWQIVVIYLFDIVFILL